MLTAGAANVPVGLAVSVVLPADELSASSGPLLAVVSAAGVGVPPRLSSLISLFSLIALVANGALLTMIIAGPPGWRLSRPQQLPFGTVGAFLRASLRLHRLRRVYIRPDVAWALAGLTLTYLTGAYFLIGV